MTNLWHSFIANWAVPFASWLFGTFTGATFRWFYPSRKEWKAERRAKAEAKLDRRVHEALGDNSLWKGPRGMTGAGFFAVRSNEIAECLKVDAEVATESLERLKAKGMANKETGTFEDASPIWIYMPR